MGTMRRDSRPSLARVRAAARRVGRYVVVRWDGTSYYQVGAPFATQDAAVRALIHEGGVAYVLDRQTGHYYDREGERVFT